MNQALIAALVIDSQLWAIVFVVLAIFGAIALFKR